MQDIYKVDTNSIEQYQVTQAWKFDNRNELELTVRLNFMYEEDGQYIKSELIHLNCYLQYKIQGCKEPRVQVYLHREVGMTLKIEFWLVFFYI